MAQELENINYYFQHVPHDQEGDPSVVTAFLDKIRTPSDAESVFGDDERLEQLDNVEEDNIIDLSDLFLLFEL